MPQFRHSLRLLLFGLALAISLKADIVLTFDDLSEGDVVSNQFASLGVAIGGNPVVLTAMSWLNEIDFPPHSGVNVLSDLDGPISFTFLTGATSVSGFLTYGTQITIDVFDRGGNLLTTAFSAGSSNIGSNEFFSFAGDIGSISIAGAPSGNGPSFTLDDLSFNAVPEPTAILLIFPIAACVLFGWHKRSWR